MPSDPGASERRRYKRRRRPGAVSFRVGAAAGGPWLDAQLVDLSAGGVGLLSDRRLEGGTVLTLRFAPQAGVIPVLAHVRVAHAQEQPDGRWLLGCEFVAAAGDDELPA